MNHFDAVIIGAGPAGLRAAKILSENNKKVLVLEKNKSIGEKICAGGLCFKDFDFIPKSLVDKFYQIKITTPKKSYLLKEDYPVISTISREKLGNYLAEQAEKAGACILKNACVSKIDKDYVYFGKKKVFYDILIGADGANSIVRQYLKLKSFRVGIGIQYKVRQKFNDIEIVFDSKRFGIHYAWIFPHKDFSFVGAGSANNLVQLAVLKNNLKSLMKERKIKYSEKDFQALPIRSGYSGYKFGNIYLVGEAAGLAMEISGEGIYQAIVSGEEIAKKIIDENYACPKLKRIIKLKKLHNLALHFFGMLFKINPKLCQMLMDNVQSSLQNKKKRRFILKALNLEK